jgi:hypothetical protein
MFEIPPPKLPDVLPAIVELLTVTVPLGWTLIPPPLIGASLLMITERSTVVAPLLRIAPPPENCGSSKRNPRNPSSTMPAQPSSCSVHRSPARPRRCKFSELGTRTARRCCS